MRITWEPNVNAPHHVGRIVADDGRDVLIQPATDGPGVASAFGGSARGVQRGQCGYCDHSATDGTIDCSDCGVSASAFIRAAGEYLDDAGGVTVDDPGYFEGVQS